jgi:hypothetical protein
MSFVDSRVRSLEKYKRGLEKTRTALEQFPDERQEKIDAVRRDVGLTEAAKALRIKAVEEEMRKKRLKLEADADEHAAGVNAIRQRLETSGQVEPTAQVRVRGLLDKGVPPLDIAQHVYRAGDVEAAVALRAEALTIGTQRATRRGMTQFEFGDSREIIDTCNFIIGELGSDTDAEAHRLVNEIGEIARPLPAIIKLARVAAVSERSEALIAARLEAGHAINDAKREATG